MSDKGSMSWSRACLLAALAAQGLLACDTSRNGSDGNEGPYLVWDAGYLNKPDASDAGEPLPEPDVEAPPGWHRWPFPPEDCAMFVPDDIATVQPPPWEVCPYMPDGCTRATSPWAVEAGWGYGGALQVTVVAGKTYLVVSRQVHKDGWWEILLLRDNAVIGAWRSQVPQSQCGLSAPWVEQDGKASAIAMRWLAENAPHAYLSTPETLMTAPERTEIFGPPDADILASGPTQRTDRLLVIGEHYGRFAVRDLLTGATYRPEPAQAYLELPTATPLGDAVAYWAWTGLLASVWRWTPDSNEPLLKDSTYSYDYFVTDGTDAAWTRSTGQTDINTFSTVELWTSPVGQGIELSNPKKIATLPVNGIVPLSIGEGWIAVYNMPEMIRLYRISDGLALYVPGAPDVCYNAWGQYDGLVIAGGALWVKTCAVPGAGNDIRFITRFDISKLPAL